MFRILQKNKQFFSELNKYFDNFVVKLTYVNYSSSENRRQTNHNCRRLSQFDSFGTNSRSCQTAVTIMIRLSHVFACEAF